MATILNNKGCLSTQKAADFLGLTPRTLTNWRSRGVGPKFIRTGGIYSPVIYRISDIETWLDEREKVTEQGGQS